MLAILLLLAAAPDAKACAAAVAAGRRELARRRLEPAAEVANDALGLAGCRSAALALLADLAIAQGRTAEGVALLRDAAHAAADDRRAWRRLTLQRAKLERGGRARELLAVDAALTALPRLPKGPKARAKLDELAQRAAAVFRADGDPTSERYAGALEAQALARLGEAALARERSERLLEADPSPPIARLALLAGIAAARLEGALDRELELALRLDATAFADLPPERRRFARGPEVARACARWEADEAREPCSAVARRVTGEWSFRDDSRGPARSLEESQRQYAPALKECISAAVEGNPDDPIFEGASFTLGFAIAPDGTTRDVELAPRRYAGVLGACFAERVGWLRFPRSSGKEARNLSIPYRVDSVERFGGRR